MSEPVQIPGVTIAPSGHAFLTGAFKINADGTRSPLIPMNWNEEEKQWQTDGRSTVEVLAERYPE